MRVGDRWSTGPSRFGTCWAALGISLACQTGSGVEPTDESALPERAAEAEPGAPSEDTSGSALADPADAPTAAAGTFDRDAAFEESMRLLESGQTEAGARLLSRVEQAAPSVAVYWNLGIAHAKLGHHGEALTYWKKYRTEKPGDYKGRAKLIQAYQALGDLEARDRELTELHALHATSGDAELRAATNFCREQFTEAGQQVIVLEYFDPKPPRRMSLRFSVLDASGREAYYIALSSLVSTEAFSRETGEIPPDGRLFSVDRYEGRAHQTYAFANEEPDYEKVRSLVVDALNGRVRAVSGSSGSEQAR